MRIISGNFKGKKILIPKDGATRPLKDLTKESIFNIIQHSNKFNVKIKGSRVLDLFSGVGSFGLECLSREALFLTFVENYKDVLPILKKNIHILNCENVSHIVEKNVFNHLNFEIFKKKFDIIFIDPPFKEKNLNLLLSKINKSKILNKNGILIIHRHRRKVDELPDELKIIDEKIYGISKIIFGNFN